MLCLPIQVKDICQPNYTIRNKEYGKFSSKFYTYSREDEKEKMLVVCSFSDKKENWKAPAGFDMAAAKLLLNNYEKTTLSALEPYEARVYYWKK